MENILLILSLLALVKSLFMTALLLNRWYRLGFCLLISVKHRYYGYMDRKPEVADVEDTRNIAIDSVRRNLISVKTSQTVDKKKRIKFGLLDL